MTITVYNPTSGQQTTFNGIAALKQALQTCTVSMTDYCFYPGASGWILLQEVQITDARFIPLPSLPPPVSFPPVFRDTSTSGRHNQSMDFALTVRTKHCVMAYFCFGFGVLSILFSILAAIPGVICGNIAKKQCQEDPSMLGKSWATAGLWLSWLVIIVNLLVVLAVIVFFLWVLAIGASH